MKQLSRKYRVIRLRPDGTDGFEVSDFCFVLKPFADPAALIALKAYADNAHPDIADGVVDIIEEIESTDMAGKLSDTGRKNLPYVGGPSVRR